MFAMTRGFVILGFFSIYFIITGAKNVVRYNEVSLNRGSLNRGSTVCRLEYTLTVNHER